MFAFDRYLFVIFRQKVEILLDNQRENRDLREKRSNLTILSST